jgi:hypothetical protein
MKTFLLKISFVVLFIALIGTGCKKEELEPFHAKGRIIEITGGCYGEIVLIEVENPKGIGEAGTFNYLGEEKRITYRNAIAVPYFSKIGIPDIVPQTVGTWLYFEYRELTEEEWEHSNLFLPDHPLICPAIYGSPSAPRLIITNVIDFK